jgi:hypothetical protein
MATNNRKGEKWKRKNKSYIGSVMMEGAKKSKWRGQENVE